MPRTIPEAAVAELRRKCACLRQALGQAGLSHELTGICERNLGQAENSIDADVVSRHIDNILQAVRRNLGNEISLRAASQIFDIAMGEIKRMVGDPGRNFADTVEFAVAFNGALQPGADISSFLRARPLQVTASGAALVHDELARQIRSFDLPFHDQVHLLQRVDALVSTVGIGEVVTPSAGQALLIGWYTSLTRLQYEGLIPASSVQYMMGVTIIGMAPAAGALCPFLPWTLVAQAVVLVVGLVVVGLVCGVRWAYRSVEASKAGKTISDYCWECDNSERGVDRAVDDATKDLDDSQKEDVKKALKKALDDGNLDAKQKRKVQKAMDRL